MKFEKEKKNEARQITYESALKFINGNKFKKFTSEKLDSKSKERAYKYGIRKTSFRNNEERFENYKENFQRDIEDLEFDVNNKLVPVKYLISKPNNQNKKNISVKSSLEEGKLPLINRINKK